MTSNAMVLTLTIVVAMNVFAPHGLSAQNPFAAAAQTPARTLFIEGRDLWDEGKFVDAEKKFREVLTKFPRAEQSDRTAFYLITTLIKLGRTADARAEIENFDRNYPRSTWKGDVTEKRLSINGLAPMFQAGWARGIYSANQTPRVFTSSITVAVSPNFQTVTTKLRGRNVVVNAGLEQEVLRLLIQKDPGLGIEAARERLKVNPSDPAVVTNLSTIANSGSTQALPFLLTLTGNTAIAPNTTNQALFWVNRVNKEAVSKALSDMLKIRDSIPTVAETLSRFNVPERRAALDQIVKGGGPDRMEKLDRLYKGSTNLPLRSEIIQSVSFVADPAALSFLSDIARNEKEAPLRSAAIRALAERKDVDAKTFEDILKSFPPTPARPVPVTRKQVIP